MRIKLVAGNWKMNGSLVQTRELIAGIASELGDKLPCDVAVCPSYVYLMEAATALEGSGIDLGGQSICAEDEGAFTGEISGAMLKETGCRFAIVGHSERRALYGEDNAAVSAKFQAARRNGLDPILCVGESLEEREGGITEDIIRAQLGAVLHAVGADGLAEAVIAYEPVWAIGTGLTATPEQAQDVHAFIRGMIAQENATIADSIRILYGGSVKSSNAEDLFSMPDVDGGLIGGAALDAAGFADICRAAG
ncbi:MAG: triose-phosphate isomerase [Gammaproteobacteria bacterium]